ncbi:MAG: efflux RND transporter periplasmic adaptor subunit [Verrucomicrobiota bacterium]|nr:efflux RND transporter periplasmic adaptor subunit [Verrucomicrobiota bacterium]
MKITSTALWFVMAIIAGLLVAGCFKPFEKTAAAKQTNTQTKTLYTCGMHPWVIQDHPGNCPICGIKLEPIRRTAANPQSPAGPRKILYYKSTMIPGEISQKPGKDSMGMDMAPVYENEAASANSSVIEVDPVTMQDMDVVTTPVVSGPLRRTVRTVGLVDYNEPKETDVTTKFKGWIEKLYVDYTGELVHRGEPMFKIYSPALYAAEVEYLTALSHTSSADPDSSNLLTAAAEKLRFFDISDERIAKLAKTRTPHKAMVILSPADGFVIQKNVFEGQVDAGTTLYHLANLNTVWVYVEIYEQDLPYVRLGQEATMTLSYLPDRVFHGRVTYIYPTVNEQTRTAKVRLEFENPDYFLKPGMFAQVTLTHELAPSALLVPDSAILRSGEKNTVFVALGGGKFEPRTVVLGPEAEHDMCQVVSGVSAGERVVTSGEFMLDSESQLREAIQKMLESNQAAAVTNSSAPATNAMPAGMTMPAK